MKVSALGHHRRCYHPVAQLADPLDLGLHQVSRLEELGRGPGKPDTLGGPAVVRAHGPECHTDRQPYDQLRDRVDHVPRVAILLDLAVDAQRYAQRLWVGDLVGSHHPGTDRRRCVQALALEELAALVVLDVSRRDIVDDRVAENVVHRLVGLDVRPLSSDHHSELDFPVDLLADPGVDPDVVERAGHRSLGLGEDRGRLDLFAPGARALGGVLLVVAADGQHVTARRVERRQEGELLQGAYQRRPAGRLSGRDQLADAVHGLPAGIDQADQVRRQLLRSQRAGQRRKVHHLVELVPAHDAQPPATPVLEHQQLHRASSSEPLLGLSPVPAPKKSSSKSGRPRSSPGYPSSRVVPETSTLVQLATCIAALARCSTSNTAFPISASRRTCSWSRLSASLGERLAVGSSRIRTRGSSTSTRAMASILRSPPLSLSARRLSIEVSAGKTWVTSSIRGRTRAGGRRYPPISRFSSTVSGSKMSWTWGT